MQLVGVDQGAVVVDASGSLVTAREVARGETLFSIPEAAWITMDTVKDSPIGPLVAELEPWLALALFVLHERGSSSSSGASAVHAYIASLPADCDSPVVWSEEELALLAGTQLLTTVEGYMTYFRQKYEQLATGLFAAHPDAFPGAVFSYEGFVWAVCTVRARVHAPLEGEAIALVPLADLVRGCVCGCLGGGAWA
jgi:[ribulose-bisphosphate carboxylase]-lysine N-methyltransferase